MRRTTGPKRGAARLRRREVQEHLSRAELAPARFPRPVGQAAAGASSPAVRFAGVLHQLGGLFPLWGRYLSSRLDLLPEATCLELAALPDERPAAPWEQVVAKVGECLGRELELDRAALRSRWLFEEHRALLPDGLPAVVRLLHPEAPDELERDLGLLGLCDHALAQCGLAGTETTAAVDDFSEAVRASLDFSRTAEALDVLLQDGTASGFYRVPRVERAFVGAEVLTLELIPGLETAESPAMSGAAEILASQLCRAFLHQALHGRLFPAEIGAGDLGILAGHQLVLTPGDPRSLPALTRTHLWEYLTASAAQQPDRALEALLKEMSTPPQSEDVVRRRFRQLVPFRDGGRDDLAGYLFLHWRIAVEEGARPRPELVSFLRGLAQVARQARRLAGHRGDPLREAVEGMQFSAGMDEWVQLADPAQLKMMAGTYMSTMLTLPQRLDEALSRAADGQASFHLRMAEPPAAKRRKNASSAVMAILLALAATALLSRQLEEVQGVADWVREIPTAVLILLGIYFLRAVSRGASK